MYKQKNNVKMWQGSKIYRRDAARIVNGSRDEKLPLAVNNEGAVVVSDIVSCCQVECEEEEEDENERRK